MSRGLSCLSENRPLCGAPGSEEWDIAHSVWYWMSPVSLCLHNASSQEEGTYGILRLSSPVRNRHNWII